MAFINMANSPRNALATNAIHTIRIQPPEIGKDFRADSRAGHDRPSATTIAFTMPLQKSASPPGKSGSYARKHTSAGVRGQFADVADANKKPRLAAGFSSYC